MNASPKRSFTSDRQNGALEVRQHANGLVREIIGIGVEIRVLQLPDQIWWLGILDGDGRRTDIALGYGPATLIHTDHKSP